MNAISKKARRYFSLIAVILLVTTSIVLFRGERVISNNASAAESLFVSNGMSVSTDYSPEIDGEDIVDAGRKGILLSAENEGAIGTLSLDMAGLFEIDFRVFSEMTYDTPDAWSQSTYRNEALDLSELIFTFKEKNGSQSFSVTITGGESYNVITPTAKVAIGTAVAGLHYVGAATTESDTAFKNAGGYYTRLWGTTFCNYARTVSAEIGMGHSNVIGFDPLEMLVYGYDYSSGSQVKRPILYLNDESFIGEENVMNSFGDYTVSITMSKIAVGRTGKMVIYSLNDQSLAGEVLVNDMGPTTQVRLSHRGVVGIPYTVPEPAYTFDIFDGKNTAFSGAVGIIAPDDSIVSPSEDGTFTPTMSGTYKISWTAKDRENVAGMSRTLSLDVAATHAVPVMSVERSAIFSHDIVIGRGRTLRFPAASAYSPLVYNIADNVLPVSASVEGMNYSASAEFSHTFNTLGTQILTYKTADDIYGVCTEIDYVVTVLDIPYFSGAEVRSSYEYGSDFVIPNNAVDGYTVSHRLLMPDGSVSTDDEVILNQLGWYTLYYSFVHNNQEYFDYYEFVTDLYTSKLFEGTSYSTITSNVDTPPYLSTRYNGVRLKTTRAGSAIKYIYPIDFKESDLSVPFVELMVVPSEPVFEMSQVIVRLRDSKDSSQYIEISLYRDTWGYSEITRVSVRSSAYNVLTGCQYGGGAGYHDDKRYGTEVRHSFSGAVSGKNQLLGLYYLAQENAIYVGSSYHSNAIVKVLDLDDHKVVGKGNEFEGFASGRVMMEIEMNELVSGVGQILVTSVGGMRLTGKNIANDGVAPKLYLDLNDNVENCLPKAVVGMRYPIFTASAFDAIDGEIKPNINVYYGVVDGELYATNAKYFIPNATGKYYIVYEAKDNWGNTVSKTLEVVAVASLDQIALDFKAQPKAEAYVGEKILIEQPRLLNMDGWGAYKLATYILDGNKSLPLATSFVPQYAATFTLRYRIVTHLRSFDFDFSVIVTENPNPTPTEAVLPFAFLDGRRIFLKALPEYETEIDVTYAGETVTLGKDLAFTPNVINHGDTVTVAYYQIIDGMRAWSKSYEIPVVKTVIEGEKQPITNYFYTEGFDIRHEKVSSTFMTSQAESTDNGNSYAAFINTLYAPDFSVQFTLPTDVKFSSFSLYLKDSINAKQFVKISYICVDGEMFVSINDGEKTKYDGGYAGRTLSIRYDAHLKAITDGNGFYFYITDTLKTLDFDGFTSGYVYFAFALHEVTSNTGIELIRLCNQVFTAAVTDTVMPVVYVADIIRKEGDIGMRVKIPYAVAYDVLSDTVSLLVTVIAPDGTRIFDGLSAEIDRYFVAEQYGVYRITYTAVDGNSRRNVSNFSMKIIDRIPPVILFGGRVASSAKIGQEIALPTVTVSDNMQEVGGLVNADSDVTLYVFVIGPDGVFTLVKNNKIVFNKPGNHIVRYYAEDAAGNYALQNFTIAVEN